MQIYVNYDEKILSFVVKPDFTVRQLKGLIHDRLGIVPTEQTLLFKGGILKDTIPLFQYDIQEGNVFTLFTYLPIKKDESKFLNIFIKTLIGKEIALVVDPSLTIEQLKCEIKEKTDIPSEQQKIIFAGAQLENNRTLESYNLKSGITLNVVPKAKAGN